MIRDYPAGVKLAESYQIRNLTIIPAKANLEEEQQVLRELVKQYNIDVLFLEITERPLSDYTHLPKVKKACISFDGKIPEGMDLVIDWDVEALKFHNPKKYPKSTFLLGPEYVILPFNFDQKRIAARSYKKYVETILIAMGGADEHNVTASVVNALLEGGLNAHLYIVIGSGYSQRKTLKETLKAHGANYTISQNLTNMFEAYMGCDVAIGAGGLTASELVATRTPAILIATYEHQVARCQYFHEKGWVNYFGFRSCEGLIGALRQRPPITDNPPFHTHKIVEAVCAL